jgi:hypothetical protein
MMFDIHITTFSVGKTLQLSWSEMQRLQQKNVNRSTTYHSTMVTQYRQIYFPSGGYKKGRA